MLRIGRHSSASSGLATWPALLCLALGVLAPSAALLWFMNRAVQNEHLAVREKLERAYVSQLSLYAGQLGAFWNSKAGRIETLRTNFSGSALFAEVVSSGLADGFAAPDFPGPPQPVASTVPHEGANDAALALQAAAREARSAGRTNDAAARLHELGGTRFEFSRDAQGRLLAPYADLAFLETASPDDPRRTEVENRLSRRASYGNTNLPPAQRRFLISEATALRQSTSAALLEAELFTLSALGHLKSNSSGLHHNRAQRWVAFQTNGYSLFLREETLRKEILRGLGGSTAEILFAVLPPEARTEQQPLASAEIPDLPGWRMAASLKDSSDLGSAARRQIAVYLWVSALVLAAVAIASLAAARLLLRQSRAARLKNDLLANVTHELKTPLASTRVLVETLIDSPALDERTTREYLDLIARENRRLTGLIENFLAFSRMERNRFSFDLAPVFAANIVQRAASAVRERFASEQVQFSIAIPEDLPKIQADADSLETALINLLENALKYSEPPRRIELRASGGDGVVVFEVRDNGIGIAPREHKRIFERFYQVDQSLSRPVGGCGLGLSIVDFIVRAHGGKVRVQSEPERGSTFSIELPALAPEPQPLEAMR